MKRIIGVDIDGVLANFNGGFIDKVIEITGRDLFPPRPFEIPCWNYPQFYGYTEEENTAVWQAIEADPKFWFNLGEYPETRAAIAYLRDRVQDGDDVYFVTSRPGLTSKIQTERWLRKRGIEPTVLISSRKGAIAKALNFDVYIDDKWENCVDVSRISLPKYGGGISYVPSKTRTLMLDQPWNRGFDADSGYYTVVDKIVGLCEYCN